MNNNGELLQVFTPKFVHDTIEKMNNNAMTREEAVKILSESDWLEPELLSEIQKQFRYQHILIINLVEEIRKLLYLPVMHCFLLDELFLHRYNLIKHRRHFFRNGLFSNHHKGK